MRAPNRVTGKAAVGLLLVSAAILGCSSVSSASAGAGACGPDQNGVAGGTNTIKLTVTDTAFTVGAIGIGPGEPNITTENSANLRLTMTNAGTRPHDLVIACLPTPGVPGCPAQSCFPAAANLPAVMPGDTATVVFVTPVREGAYPFTSDLPGDTQTAADGAVTGLVGEFVVM